MTLILNIVPQISKRFREKLDAYNIKYEFNLMNSQFKLPIRKFLYSTLEQTEFNIVFHEHVYIDLAKDNVIAFEVKE